MEDMKETYSSKQSQYKIREDVTLTVTTLKKYLYFLQSISAAHGQELVKAADIITNNGSILKVYQVLNQNLVYFWKNFHQTELIQIMFELSQKRTL